MNLRFVPLDEQGEDIRKTKYLFEHAFLPAERPPFSLMLRLKRPSFYAVYDEGKYVGIAFLLKNGDLLYVFFLAICKRYRNKGYGSAVLGRIQDDYPSKRIFLLADEAAPSYPDFELRKRRLAFYARNGFVDSGLIITEFGVRYHLLALNNVSVSEKEFLQTMMEWTGKEAIKRYYPAYSKYWD